MSKKEATLAAGYSESFSKVNVYRVVNSTEFQEELAHARLSSSQTTKPSSVMTSSQPTLPRLDPRDGLALKEQLFRDYYVGEARGNGTLAARLAGYSGNANALGVMAHQLLRKPKMRQSIE